MKVKNTWFYSHRKSSPKKRVPSAEAPVTTEEIMQMKDPLDFLAKYCIIRYTQTIDHITPCTRSCYTYFVSWTIYVLKKNLNKITCFINIRSTIFISPAKTGFRSMRGSIETLCLVSPRGTSASTPSPPPLGCRSLRAQAGGSMNWACSMTLFWSAEDRSLNDL